MATYGVEWFGVPLLNISSRSCLRFQIRRDVLGSKRPKGFDPDAPVDQVYENLKEVCLPNWLPRRSCSEIKVLRIAQTNWKRLADIQGDLQARRGAGPPAVARSRIHLLTLTHKTY